MIPRPSPSSQIEWLLSHLRWLGLAAAALVALLAPDAVADNASLALTLAVLGAGVAFNLIVVLLLAAKVAVRPLAVASLAADSLLSVALYWASGQAASPLLWVALFPTLTAALRFGWQMGLGAGIAIVVVDTLAALTFGSADPFVAFIPLTYGLFLVGAPVVTGLVAQRARPAAGEARAQPAAPARQPAAPKDYNSGLRDRSKAIFEMASLVSATLNYERVIDAALDLSVQGMQEFGRDAGQLVSAVMLYQSDQLTVAAARRLTPADMKVVLTGEGGVLGDSQPHRQPAIGQRAICRPGVEQVRRVPRLPRADVPTAARGLRELRRVPVRPPARRLLRRRPPAIVGSGGDPGGDRAAKRQTVPGTAGREGAHRRSAGRGAQETGARPARRPHPIHCGHRHARELRPPPVGARPQADRRRTVQIEDLARRTTKEIRHMLFTLRPLILESQGLSAALRQLADKMGETHGQNVIVEAAEGVEEHLELNQQGVLFYIVEEAVNNARKHAEAAHIWVRLRAQNDLFILEVEDDGVGFNVGAVDASYEQRGSLGMVNMRERAALVNGLHHIEVCRRQGHQDHRGRAVDRAGARPAASMTAARRILAGAAALYAVGLALWLAREEPWQALAPWLGAGGAGLAVAFAAAGDAGPAHEQTTARRLARAGAWGLAGGALAPAWGAALMVLRTALHAQYEFPQAVLTGLLARTPVWAGAGAVGWAGRGVVRAGAPGATAMIGGNIHPC